MIPIFLFMKNFTSHVLSEIDFTQFNTTLVVGANDGNPKISNAVGKTAIFDAVRFALYGKTRFNKKEKVVKRGKIECKVIFQFILDNEEYKIERTLNKKTSVINVIFSKKEDGIWKQEALTCDTSSSTNTKIEDIIGMSHDTFVNCVYFGQNDISGFAGARTGKRREILKEVLRIKFWDELQEVAKDKEKRFLDQKTKLEERIETIGDVNSIKKEVQIKKEKVLKDINDIKNSNELLENRLGILSKKINKLEVQAIKVNCTDYKDLRKKLDTVSNEIDEAKIRRDQIKEEVQKNNETIVNAQNDCVYLEKQLLDLSRILLITEHKIRNKAETIFRRFCNETLPVAKFSLMDINNKKEDLKTRIEVLNNLKLQLSQLTALEPGKECPTCLSTIENPENVLSRRESKKKFLSNQIEEVSLVVSEMKSSIQKEQESLTKADEAALEIERTELIIAKRMADVTGAEQRNDNLRKNFSYVAKKWQELKEKKEEIKVQLNTIENSDSYQNDLVKSLEQQSNVQKELNKNREKLMDLAVQSGRLDSDLISIEHKISEKQALLLECEKILSETEIYSEVGKAFGKDGIQAIIMENITEDLKNYSNIILKQICNEPMSVDFVTQRQTVTGSWKEDFNVSVIVGNEEMDFDDLSGGEQVRVSIALRVALSKLLMQRIGSNIKFLLLDEADQALDGHGIEVLFDAIMALSKEFKIMLITHNEIMKEKFEHVITVLKGPTGSVVRQ